MKLFIYKSLIAFTLVLILFKLTFGKVINDLEKRIYYFTSSQNIQIIKEKIRNELSNIEYKKRVLSKDDAILINKFLNKVSNELEESRN
jgi:hypothetical protein